MTYTRAESLGSLITCMHDVCDGRGGGGNYRPRLCITSTGSKQSPRGAGEFTGKLSHCADS